jgi:hypothetical protein
MEELAQQNNIIEPVAVQKKRILKRSKSLASENVPSVVTKEYLKKLLKEIEEDDDTIILNKKNREVVKQCDKDLIESEKEVRQNKNHMLLQILSNLDLEDYDSPLNDIMSNYGSVILYLENKNNETAIMKWQMDDYWMVKLFHKELEHLVKQYEKFRSDILMSLN